MTNVYVPASTDAVETAKARAIRMAVRGVIGAGLAAAVAVGTAGAASAQASDSGATDAKVEVQSSIVLSGLTPSFMLSGIPGSTPEGLSAVTFNVETNNSAGYAVTVQSQDALMAGSAGNTETIAIGALSVKESAGAVNSTNAAYKVVTTGAQQVHTQATKSADGGDLLSNDFKV